MRHAMTLTLALAVLFALGMASPTSEMPAPEAKAAPAAGAAAPEAKPAPQRIVDLAICLDTSNSMDGLIGSAKQKLWAIVNELATAKPKPKLRVALYQYGNDNLRSLNNGWVQKVCDLTDDLDTVYEKLFALKTHGGTEYVSRVVRAATSELEWSGRGSLKIIVVAGNEAATQDKTYPLQDTCKAAVTQGIIINTIFCGNVNTGRQTGWADAARWADGQYAAIDQNTGTVVVKTPYDKKIADLGTKLNKTYVAYGAKGKAGKERQTAQDANAASVSAPAAAQRVAAKSSGLYTNAQWDLVDAVEQKKVDLAKVEAKDLPEPMRKMSVEQRTDYVKQQSAKRVEIQKQVKELDDKRQAHVKAEMAKRGLDESKSFDAALRNAVRTQAEKAGMTFEK